MPDPTEDLRATEEAIQADARSIAEMEADKQSLPPTSPRVAELSDQIKRATSEMDAKAAAEQELSREVSSSDAG